MKKYIIPKLNGQDEIVDPTIEIIDLATGKLLNVNLDFINNLVSLGIYIVTTQSKFYHYLTDIQVEEMIFGNGSMLHIQVITALDEQFLVVE